MSIRAGNSSSSRCSLYDGFRGARGSFAWLVTTFPGLTPRQLAVAALAPTAGVAAASPRTRRDIRDAPFAFEDERARDDMVDECAVVADQEQRARPGGQPFLEEFERLDVEVVRRLVQHQHIDRPGKQPRQQQPVALAAGQRFHGRQRPLGRKQEIAQVAVDVLGAGR